MVVTVVAAPHARQHTSYGKGVKERKRERKGSTVQEGTARGNEE